MNRNPVAHTAHDELLLARLYGGDLEGRERERALELTASCALCAAVLADYEAIATATAALPAPPRPRGFTLTPDQAAALRRRRIPRNLAGLRGIVSSLGPVRSLGASMMTAGAVGILAVGILSTFGQTGTSSPVFDQAAGPLSRAEASGYESLATAGSSGKNGVGQATATKNPFEVLPSAVPAAASTALDTAGGSPGVPSVPSAVPPAPSGEIAIDGQHPTGGDTKGGAPPSSPRGGPDAIVIWLVGLAGLAAAGLVMLTAPSLRRSSRVGRSRR